LPTGQVRQLDAAGLAGALAAFGHPGFAFLRSRRRIDPAAVLLAALGTPNLEARTFEALPWVAVEVFGLDWDWLLAQVKLNDVQNRLGFVVTLARRLAERQGDVAAVSILASVEEGLQRSRLAREDTHCHESMKPAERVWLSAHRPSDARQWNLLTDVVPEVLRHACRAARPVAGLPSRPRPRGWFGCHWAAAALPGGTAPVARVRRGKPTEDSVNLTVVHCPHRVPSWGTTPRRDWAETLRGVGSLPPPGAQRQRGLEGRR
jgi:hypothetical protein